jgi:S1-C subfamily serine protease
LITALQPVGPAEKAGLVVGDSIESVDGKAVATADDLATVLATLRPGQKVTVVVTQPDGSSSTRTVTLGVLPGS